MSCEALSVVVPMHRTARWLPELLRRLGDSVPGADVVLVDDACPDGSGDLAAGIGHHGLTVTVVRVHPNVGQHAAVQIGLRHCTRALVAVMDADLQDAPEDIPVLLDRLLAHPEVDAVCAARTGRYASAGRRATARGYRAVASALTRGRIPRDAGMFMVMRAEAAAGVARLDDPMAPLVPALAATGARLHAMPLERHPRGDGGSGYDGRMRLRVAVRGLAVLTPARAALARRHRHRLLQVAPTITVQPLTSREPHHG